MAGRELTITPTKRERRKSPAMSFASDSSSAQPPLMSPTSSVADTTFEPTIDMMVNDFDDEATLNEEEALADQEAQNPEDEIATLREESEMPIEELLAKYSSMTSAQLAPSPAGASSFKRSSSSSRRRRATKRQYQESELGNTTSTSVEAESSVVNESEAGNSVEPAQHPEEVASTASDDTERFNEGVTDNDEVSGVLPPEVTKKHRSHLLDLYPDESFGSSAHEAMEDVESFTPLQTLFDEVEAGEEEEDSDTDSDDARKIIMVGADYQAEIPDGLSLYGDVLPYENEDQLIWEPSQVTEREVEDYLAKIQETRSLALPTEEGVVTELQERVEGDESAPAEIEANVTATPPTASAIAPTLTGSDLESVVKDNEQALHLLVQCGYDFKEALRRKRLNVLPLSDTMSSWSEEECQKFEEGIQKFGKDFYQIRQNQVRTRTMRELVQFYYLWKKSERRDQSFALNDTIDHMDVFINEGGNGNGNGIGIGIGTGNGNNNGSCSSHTSSSSSGSNGHSNANGNANIDHTLDKDVTVAVPAVTTRKSTSKNYSIMTGSNGGGTGVASGTSRKRGASSALDNEDNEDNENVDSLS